MEFLIPIKYTGIKHQRVTADTLQEALEIVSQKADIQTHCELTLSNSQFDILAPRLMISEEEKESWPYWEYGYTGTDGVDWHVGYTNKGKKDIPEFAETIAPVPVDWLESWRDK